MARTHCQVEGLTQGGPPPVDLTACAGSWKTSWPPPWTAIFSPGRRHPRRAAQTLAFSGNSEPTAAAAFPEAVASVRDILAARGLAAAVKIRLITNGSLEAPSGGAGRHPRHRRSGGEVWFKVDRVGGSDASHQRRPQRPRQVLRNLRRTAALALTWVQTCWFAIDGAAPRPKRWDAYCAWLGEAAARAGRRPSLRPGLPFDAAGAARLGRLAPISWPLPPRSNRKRASGPSSARDARRAAVKAQAAFWALARADSSGT